MRETLLLIAKYFVFSILLLTSIKTYTQTTITSKKTNTWYDVMRGTSYDPNDDNGSNTWHDLVGNSTHPLLLSTKSTSAEIDYVPGSTNTYQSGDIYHFRVRMGTDGGNNNGTYVYLAIDYDFDDIAEVFIEANDKEGKVNFHIADSTVDGLTPATTQWINSTSNSNYERDISEFYYTDGARPNPVLDLTNSGIFRYDSEIGDYTPSSTDLDSDGNTDIWIEFAFSETSLTTFILDAFGDTVNGDSQIALFLFTSQGNTPNPNGDIAGLNGFSSNTETWESLGVIVNTSLNSVSTGDLIIPTVDSLTTTSSNFTLTGTWGGDFGGDDSLSVTVNGITYTSSTSTSLSFTNNNWFIDLTGFSSGTYEVIATTTSSRNVTASPVIDITSNELIVNLTDNDAPVITDATGNL
ncbi:MAG: hypothetical protein HWD84_10645, partial [Flavobacteriaceae bacterium]|nr:hypothetical protein [Flavobacteriaceae bacterium]